MFVLLLSVVTGALGQVSLKKGMLSTRVGSLAELASSPGVLLGNGWLWLGGALYGASFALWLVVLSRMDLSKAYPMVSLGYLVTSLLGVLLFGEHLSATRISGLAVVMVGVFLLARS